MAFLMFPILGENLCSTSSSSATAEQQSCIDHYCYGELPTSSALLVTKTWFRSFSLRTKLLEMSTNFMLTCYTDWIWI